MLALLVLHANETVPIDRLVDELWAEQPPPSAGHTLEGYVSRLRRSIEPHGARIVRRGSGYELELRNGAVDLQTAERRLAEAIEALSVGSHDRCSELAREALGLWRGPALADVPLKTEAARLEDLRLRLIEARFDADLALGRHAELVAELPTLVEEHPYRERFAGQLMVALYRAGRQAEALDVYERTRSVLDEELGLQPSAELRRLSGEIVRQEPRLTFPTATAPAEPRAKFLPRRRAALAVVAVGLIVAATTAVFVRAADERSGSPRLMSVALVLPGPLEAGGTTAITSDLVDGLRAAEREYGIRPKTFVADEFDVDDPGTETTLAAVRRGDFDLAILFSRALAETLLPAIIEAKGTRFVVLDASVAEVGGLSNVTGLLFRNEQSGYLVGYLSGLMEAERGVRLNENRVVSRIGGFRGLPAVEEFMDAFARGARGALPGVRILTGYTEDFLDQSKCEELANRHIDAGADIVFAAAGECSLGALRAAGIRGAWGVGVDGDRSSLGDHILASAVKRFDEAVLVAVRSLSHGTLPGGQDVVLGIEDDAVGIAGISPEVPQAIRSKVARAAADLGRTSKG